MTKVNHHTPDFPQKSIKMKFLTMRSKYQKHIVTLITFLKLGAGLKEVMLMYQGHTENLEFYCKSKETVILHERVLTS